jgi:hypothetical protein
MLRLRRRGWSGVRSGEQDGTSGATNGALAARSGETRGAQVQPREQRQLQAPEQPSNFELISPSGSSRSNRREAIARKAVGLTG